MTKQFFFFFFSGILSPKNLWRRLAINVERINQAIVILVEKIVEHHLARFNLVNADILDGAFL